MIPENNTKSANGIFNPFPGLRPFKVEESHLFFGREGQSEEILKKLADEKFVAVIGASGSGKSSLIYCGLVPTLYGGFVGEAKSKWNIIASRPGNAPIENMASAILAKTSDGDKDDLIKQKLNASILRSSSNGLIEILDQSFDFEKENVLIIIDQFEELFRYKSSRKDQSTYNESEAFVKLLVNANKTPDIPVYVVLTMRSDFIGECSQFHELTELINDSNYLVPQMTRDDFKQAIEGPIAVGGATIETQLVQQLLNEVGDNPDQLPILQHALMRTWDYWMDHSDKNQPINISDYEAIGRMEKALSEHANEAFDELNEEQKWICESMFKTITEKGNDNRGIRHPTSIKDIASISKAPVDQVIDVIDPFRAAGRSFITPSQEIPIDEDSIIDLSHESLMRIWNKLKVWVEEEWDAVQMYMRLSEASEMYQVGSTGLWRPPDLQLALNWREKQKPTLDWAQRYNPAFERAMVYLETSDKDFRAEEENKVKLQKRQLRRSKIFAIVLGSAAIVAMGLTVYSQMLKTEAVKQEQEANRQKLIAEENEQKATDNYERAEEQTKLALQRQQEAEEQRQRAIENEKQAVINAQLAQEQKELAVKRQEEATRERERAEENAELARKESIAAEKARQEAFQRRMLSIAQSMSVKSVQISDDIQLKALVAYQAYLFNKSFEGSDHNPDVYSGLYYALKGLKGDSYNAVNGHSGSVMELAFIPGTSKMYSTGGDGRILRWDIDNLQSSYETILENPYGQRSLGITSDGKWLICATDDNKILVLDNTNKIAIVKELLGHTRSVSKIIVAPNNKFFISASIDRTIRKWDLTNFESVILAEDETRINDMDISPDSKYLVYSTKDGRVRKVDVNDTTRLEVIRESSNISISSVKFNKSGKWLVIGASNGDLKILDAESYNEIQNLEGGRYQINDIDFIASDQLMATASQDGTVRLWDCIDLNNQPIELKDHQSWALSNKFSPDNKRLISTSKDKDRIIVWPIKTEYLANDLKELISRNMTQDEWNIYVAEDIDYEKTLVNIN
ncbi:MAG: hypothetical protein C0597_09500 [Marinilabiliales bacterium]|nr:MAG: hypothetical protein C0597_09500 [Marinilabiliales bacterium]